MSGGGDAKVGRDLLDGAIEQLVWWIDVGVFLVSSPRGASDSHPTSLLKLLAISQEHGLLTYVPG